MIDSGSLKGVFTMRKTISLMLCFLLALSLLSACGESDNDNFNLDTFGSAEVSQQEDDPEPEASPATVTDTETTPAVSSGVYVPELEEEQSPAVTQMVEKDESGTSATPAPTSKPISNSTDSGSSGGSSTPAPSTKPTTTPGGGTKPSDSDSGSSGGSGGSSGGSATPASAVEKAAEEKSLPDQTDGTVQYALADIDGDGSSELLVRYPSSTGTREVICTYDADGNLTVTGNGLYGGTYYDNGSVVTGASDPQGYSSGVLSPYSIYVNDGGNYYKSVTVAGWNSELSSTEDGENTFPDYIDEDGNGHVYMIYGAGGDGAEIVDDAEYFSWYAAIMGDAQPVSISYTTVG